MITKAAHKKIFQNVVDQIENAILEGKPKIGDKLLSERE